MADIENVCGRAELEVGDIVRAIPGAPYSITSGTAIMRVIQKSTFGDSMKVLIIRNSNHVGMDFWVDSKYFYKIKSYKEQKRWIIKDGEDRMVKEDWIVRNWDFLKARKIVSIPMTRARNILQEDKVLTTGKFYGSSEFIDQMRGFSSIRYNGTMTLFLRPFISAPMPDGVLAVYVDPKRYKFDEDGIITGLSSTYEFPIYIFRN